MIASEQAYKSSDNEFDSHNGSYTSGFMPKIRSILVNFILMWYSIVLVPSFSKVY